MTMNERKWGLILLGSNERIAPNSFVLVEPQMEVHTGDEIVGEEKMTLLLNSERPANLSDKLFALGISLRENNIGRNVLLLLHPKQKVEFGFGGEHYAP